MKLLAARTEFSKYVATARKLPLGWIPTWELMMDTEPSGMVQKVSRALTGQ